MQKVQFNHLSLSKKKQKKVNDDDKNKTIQEIDREKLEKKFSNEDKGKLN